MSTASLHSISGSEMQAHRGHLAAVFAPKQQQWGGQHVATLQAPSFSSPVVQAVTRGQVRCWNCNGSGHRAREPLQFQHRT